MKRKVCSKRSETGAILAKLQNRIEEALDSLTSDRLPSDDGYGALASALDTQIRRAKKRLQRAE